jgi:S1-C subfamily serine protease
MIPTGVPPAARPRKRHRSPLATILVAAAALLVVLATFHLVTPVIQTVRNAAGSTASAPPAAAPAPTLSTSAITRAVDPGLVDIVAIDRTRGVQSAGTGIVLTATGTILTNDHVITGATSISVTDIGNHRTYVATVVGQDSADDVAVLHARGASGLHVAPLGTSAGVAAGDPVLAIGNAGGTGGTPSTASGTVVATDQPVTARNDDGSQNTLTGMIEVRAAIRPGDSGGPLVNSAGKVVGIDTAATTETKADTDVRGYAIPIDRALQILQTAGIAA